MERKTLKGYDRVIRTICTSSCKYFVGHNEIKNVHQVFFKITPIQI